ncbi:MAG: hypothetical protein EBT97_08070 [Actinobacteria bacterium]|nr:hypothetical protein [Actinomycetota bacterium]
MIPRRVTRAVASIAACLLLASCRVDTGISLEVKPNGSGTVTVTVTADAAVVAAAPTLRTDVRADDLVAAGWKMTGPEETEDKGLTVSFSRGFDTPEEATVLLSQVNGGRGPLKNMVLARTGKNSNSTFTLTGTLEVNGGLEAFADDAAIKLLGGAPYEDQVSNSGLDLGTAAPSRGASPPTAHPRMSPPPPTTWTSPRTSPRWPSGWWGCWPPCGSSVHRCSRSWSRRVAVAHAASSVTTWPS